MDFFDFSTLYAMFTLYNVYGAPKLMIAFRYSNDRNNTCRIHTSREKNRKVIWYADSIEMKWNANKNLFTARYASFLMFSIVKDT